MSSNKNGRQQKSKEMLSTGTYGSPCILFCHSRSNLNKIQNLSLNLHTLSIMLVDGSDLIPLLKILPNIHCFHVSLTRMNDIFESSEWSSVVLPHLVVFKLWAELAVYWTYDELMILLRVMPTLQQLSLNIVTRDTRLIDGEQIRSLFSAVNILYLHKFNYAVGYFGRSLPYSIIVNLQQKWSPQPIAFTCDATFSDLYFYTIPFQFHRFWTHTSSDEAKKFSTEQKFTRCYGNGASIAHCTSHIPAELIDLYDIMKTSCHIKKLTLLLPHKGRGNFSGKYFQILRKHL